MFTQFFSVVEGVTEILALLTVIGIGYYNVIDQDFVAWWHKRLDSLLSLCRSRISTNQNLIYFVAVGVPAMTVGLLDVLIDAPLFHFLLSVVVLQLSLGISSYLQYQPSVIKAIYANNEKLATEIANEWEQRKDGLEDGHDHFVVRILSLCAERLHGRVISILLWFVLLGPAGVVLISANNNMFSKSWVQSLRLNPLDWISERCSNLLFMLIGETTANGSATLRLSPQEAALEFKKIDREDINLEQVPRYGSFLLRTMFIAVILSALALI